MSHAGGDGQSQARDTPAAYHLAYLVAALLHQEEAKKARQTAREATGAGFSLPDPTISTSTNP